MNNKKEIVLPDSGIETDILSSLTGYHLRRAQLKYYREFARTIGKQKISPTQFAILLIIQKNPGISQITIAHALSMAKAAIMTIIHKLENKRLVTRKKSAQDKRKYELELTPLGVKTVGKLKEKVFQVERKEIRNLTKKEQQQLIRLLIKMRAE